ncbi:hypothetical protein OUZ56_007832 [Daphnia magna]|uniref:Uncharacterized protein n=1 Tax=Daphnia magna TaxID=35525 RepID=A0ABR0AB43_9CRUS|nr:hypothetical protein OUZ56_007832 [Daphnia magna]
MKRVWDIIKAVRRDHRRDTNNCMNQVLRALAERLRVYILCNAQALESKFTTKEKTNVKSNSVQDHERLVNIRIKPSRILKG